MQDAEEEDKNKFEHQLSPKGEAVESLEGIKNLK